MFGLKNNIYLNTCFCILLVNSASEVNLYPAHKNFSSCNCVLLQSCESFNNFIDNSPNDTQIKAVIQEAVCYFDGFNIFVCCPNKLNHKRNIKEKPKLDYLDELTGLNCPPSFGVEYNYDDYLKSHHEVEPKYYDDHHHTTPQYDEHHGGHVLCDEYGNCGKTFNFPHEHDEHPMYSGIPQHYPAYYPHVHDHQHDQHHSGHDVHVPFFPQSHNGPNKPTTTVQRTTRKPSLGCGILPSVRNIEVYPWIARLAYLNTSSSPTVQSSTIRYINLPIMNNTECAIRYAKYSENFETSIVITPTEFCAQAQAMNDVCEGDSGGPFMERSKIGRYTLLGIVAFGPKTNCGQSNLPGVYMRVSSYVDWIISSLK